MTYDILQRIISIVTISLISSKHHRICHNLLKKCLHLGERSWSDPLFLDPAKTLFLGAHRVSAILIQLEVNQIKEKFHEKRRKRKTQNNNVMHCTMQQGLTFEKKAITKCSTLKVDFSANFHLTHDFFWRRLSQHPKNWKTQKGIYKYQFKGV